MAGEARSIDPVQSLWTTYAQQRDEPSRNALIEHYLPIVSKHAERLRGKLPSLVQLDELISAGVFGLMDSIEMFDPNAGVKFETYSAIRIRGAMLDELRAGDWVPRLVRTNSRKLSAATARLRQSLGREPAAEEVQSALDVSPEQFMRMTADVRPTEVVSMSAERDDDSDGPRISRQLVDERAADPVRSVQSHRLKEMLTDQLSRRERLVVMLYYYDGLTMGEVGDVLDISESRVSQLHSSVLRRLRTSAGVEEALTEAAA